MPLEKQNISFDFGSGLNEVVDSDLVEGNTLLTIQNGVYNQAGRIDKRNGYLKLPTIVSNPSSGPPDPRVSSPTSNLQGITGIHNNNGQLIAAEATRVLSFNEERQDWSHNDGYFRACSLDKQDVVASDRNIIRSSQAEIDNIRVVIFEAENHVTGYKVMDTVSNTTLFVTYDINDQLWGGPYTDEEHAGAIHASQYTQPTVIATQGKFWIFAVKDRYNFAIEDDGGDAAIPEATTPIGNGYDIGTLILVDTPPPHSYMGCKEAPKLVMFGLSLSTYQLVTQSTPSPNEKHYFYFDLEAYNNWNLTDPETGVGNNPLTPNEFILTPAWMPSIPPPDQGQLHIPLKPFYKTTDHRYLSYDVCTIRLPDTGEPDPNRNYFVVLVSSYEKVKLYVLNATTGILEDSSDTATVALNSSATLSTASGGDYNSWGYNQVGTMGYSWNYSASAFPFTQVALGQSGPNNIRTYLWRWEDPQTSSPVNPRRNACYSREYFISNVDHEPSVLIGNNGAAPGAVTIGIEVPTLHNVALPWSSYNPMTTNNIVGAREMRDPNAVAGKTDGEVLCFELEPGLVQGNPTTPIGPGSPGWLTSNLQPPLKSTPLSEPFLYLKDPQALTDVERYEMAIALAPIPDELETNFLIAEGNNGRDVICKYSQGVATKELWGTNFQLVSGPFDDHHLPFPLLCPNGMLPYNANWNAMFETAIGPPLPMNQAPVGGTDYAVRTDMGIYTCPRTIAISKDALGSGALSKYTLPTMESIQALVESGEIFGDGRVRSIDIDLSSTVTPDFITFSNDLYLNGGYMAIFDNNVITENNFHLRPVIDIGKGENADPSEGKWGYTAIYEWIDDNGNLHRSPPSVIKYVNTNPKPVPLPPLPSEDYPWDYPTRVELTLAQPIFTSKKISEVSIAVYRTVDSGSVFYRVSKITPNIMPDSPGHPNERSDGNVSIACWKRGQKVNFEDRLPDSAIIGNEILYTTGGILRNIAPPSFNLMAEYGGRIFGSGLDNPDIVYYSKIKDQNTSVEFSDALYLTTPPEGGNITALAVLDSNLIIFKENKVFRVYGDGPNDTGAGGTFSPPLLISSSHGAKSQKTVINTVEGVIFRGTDGGIFLLDRSLNFSYIGAAVQDSNNLDIVHATNVGSQNEVRLVLENGEALVYDYWFKKWTRFTNHESIDATVWNDNFTMARVGTGSGIWTQDPTSYLDVGDPILMDISTSWIKLAGIKGFQRCNWLSILGDQTDPHDVDVKIYRDYNNDPVESFTVDGSDIYKLHPYGDPECGFYGVSTCGAYGWPGDDVYQWRHKPRIQKCESIRLSLSDTPYLSGVYDPEIATNFSLKNLTLSVGVKKGQFKLLERKTV